MHTISFHTQPVDFHQQRREDEQVRQNIAREEVNPFQTEQLHSMREQVHSQNKELAVLRVKYNGQRDQIGALERMIRDRDQQIEQLRGREAELEDTISSLRNEQMNFTYGKVEYENLKSDAKRLHQMLKNTQEYKELSAIAETGEPERFLHEANKSIKTKTDALSKKGGLHFCSCNKEFIPECHLWVPEKVYEFGRGFLKQRECLLTESEYELLLYELNRVWREREKAIQNQLRAEQSRQLAGLKRRTEKGC